MMLPRSDWIPIRTPMTTIGPDDQLRLTRWLVPNERLVRVDDPVCEIEMEKATFEVTAPYTGVLHQARLAGSVLSENRVISQQPIAWIERLSESQPESRP